MKQVNTDCRVMAVVEIDKMSEKLKKAFNLLEIIQKGLNAVSKLWSATNRLWKKIIL